ncbi:unnamed protein product [Dovyalis caffra]|uniref:Uncharacterized protein n=1 Tax=Dovyalis caffra TaxID=77055 RepID=A0AAV1QMG5_9ROSI|nr:unnamed protein product [Dovyalis caffra]
MGPHFRAPVHDDPLANVRNPRQTGTLQDYIHEFDVIYPRAKIREAQVLKPIPYLGYKSSPYSAIQNPSNPISISLFSKFSKPFPPTLTLLEKASKQTITFSQNIGILHTPNIPRHTDQARPYIAS